MKKSKKIYLKILSIKDANIISLSQDQEEIGKVPFYSASVTNLASQAVAIRSGYMPFWTDTYGVR